MENQTNVQTKETQAVNSTPKQNPLVVISSVLLLLAVIVASISTIFFFVKPVNAVGDSVTYGKTESIFGYVAFGGNSLLGQALDFVETIPEMMELFENAAGGSVSEETLTELMSAFSLNISEIIWGSALSLATLIIILVNLISGIVAMCKGNRVKLRGAAVGALIPTVLAYIYFHTFTGVSGGIGADAYFIGNSPAMGIGAIIAVSLILVSSVLFFISKKGKLDSSDCKRWGASMAGAVAYSVIMGAVCLMKMGTVSGYVASSLIMSFAGLVSGSFDPVSLLYPFLNSVLYIVYIILAIASLVGVCGAFKRLLNIGEDDLLATRPKLYEKLKRADKKNYVFPIVLSVIALIAIVVLRMPAFGYGWSVDVYPLFVTVFMISAIAQACAVFFRVKEEPATANAATELAAATAAPTANEPEADELDEVKSCAAAPIANETGADEPDEVKSCAAAESTAENLIASVEDLAADGNNSDSESADNGEATVVAEPEAATDEAAYDADAEKISAVADEPVKPAASAATSARTEAPSRPAAAPGASAKTEAPKKEKKPPSEFNVHVALHIVLSLVLGIIWKAIWIYKTTKFANWGAETERNPVLAVVLCLLVPFYTYYWIYKVGERVDEIARENLISSDTKITCLVLEIFIPIVASSIMQSKINEIVGDGSDGR